LLDNPEMMDEMESKIFAIINGDEVEEEAEQSAAK